MPGPGAELLLTTGSRQEKSTVVTGKSPGAFGVVPGVVDGVVAMVDGDGLGFELTLAAGPDGLHATSANTRIANGLVISLDSNGCGDHLSHAARLAPNGPIGRR